MKALILHGSKRGGTAGLAEMVGLALATEGIEPDVRPAARRVGDISSYDVVIVGGALYAKRWHPAARRFVKGHARELRERPVWLFSSGPLDDSAVTEDIAPVPAVAALMERIGARGHQTFGGRLAPDATGFPASAMAKTRAGDWREQEHVRRWVRSIAAELRRSQDIAAPS